MSAHETGFAWPAGKRGAVSLSFDDARLSQIDVGMEVLNQRGVRATFYVSLGSVEKRLDGWKQAIARGHEIGNHTLTHPCSGNFSWSRHNALEDYSLERIEREMVGANERIEKLLGVTPTTFAYPCGQKYVGRGKSLASYVPVVAKHFVVGRSAFDEVHNCPGVMDLAQAFALDMDCGTFERIKAQIDLAMSEGGWAIFLAHDVGQGERQIVDRAVLDRLCAYCMDQANGIWLGTVAEVGSYIKSRV